MCLYIKDPRAKIVSEPITCYKVLYEKEHYNPSRFYYSTPVQDRTVHMANIRDGEPFVAYGMEEVGGNYASLSYYSDYNFTVNGGYIHTLTTHYQALSYLHSMSGFKKEGAKLVIFECEIPAGTEYYEGNESSGCKSYASKQIIFKRKID